ncbi:MAG: hypothetical protein PHU71_05400 [Candidatus Gracilibacteria bacterium]|nr:hypothetical protein [Candidatus Gracilibacteria bacterium]
MLEKKIKINRKYKAIPLSHVLSVKQNKRGVWIECIDPKTKITLRCRWYGDLAGALTVVNTALLATGQPPMIGIREK